MYGSENNRGPRCLCIRFGGQERRPLFLAGLSLKNKTNNDKIFKPNPYPRCRDYDEKGFCLKGDLCKFDHGTDAVVLEVKIKV